MYVSDTSRNLPSVSFNPRSFTGNSFLSKLLLILLHYLVKNSIQRNMNRRGEKHIGAGREKSPSFTKITRETNKKQWRANNRY